MFTFEIFISDKKIYIILNMSIKIYKLTSLIGIIVAIVCYFIDYHISLGVLLATAFSLLNMVILSSSMSAMMSSDNPNPGILMGANILRFAMLALMIYIAIKNSKIFNIVGVAIGLILFLVALVIDAVQMRKDQ